MKCSPYSPSRILLPPLLALLVATALAVTPSAGPAHATPLHLRLVRSSPAADVELAEAPAEIRLWFSEPPEVAVSMIRLEGPDGEVALEELKPGDEDTIAAAIEGALAPGEYTVRWRTSSGDGHPVRGTYVFALNGR